MEDNYETQETPEKDTPEQNTPEQQAPVYSQM